jgi:signal transduction histidine kinase
MILRAWARPGTGDAMSEGEGRAAGPAGALAEALEQQAATNEILRVIARSRGDAQPVFDTIARSAARLCHAAFCHVFRFDGTLIHWAAHHGLPPEHLAKVQALYPMAPGRGSASARAVMGGHPEEIPDIESDREYAHGAFSRAVKQRSIVAVPMMLDGAPIGVITVAREEVGHLAERKLELLKTFAEQAVIAIENTRIFDALEARNREMAEALEHQTATSDVLRSISRSRGDTHPVFDAIARSAARLCDAHSAIVSVLDGDVLRLVAVHGASEDATHLISSYFPMPLASEALSARAARARAVVNVPDVLADPAYPTKDSALAAGWRAGIGVPMMRGSELIGAIFVGRAETGAFSEAKVDLLRTFADQAVIAIENARLFDALERRHREVSEALEHQTATGEILRAISRSPDDVQPVFGIIAQHACVLCGAQVSVVSKIDGDHLDLAAVHGVTREARESIARYFPMPLDAQTLSSRAVRSRAMQQSPDVLDDANYHMKDVARAGVWRSGIAVPMMRGADVIGGIFVGRGEPGLFPPAKVELLKTFADQAVIAIENVRMFNETREALERQTGTADVLKAISRQTLDLGVVLDTVLESASRLCRAEYAHIHRYEGGMLHFAAGYGDNREMHDYLRANPLALGPGTISGSAAELRKPVHWHDVLEVAGYAHSAAQRLGGYRTMLAVPMLAGDALLGVVVLWKTRVEPFTDKQIELVTTFADQAVIAIENVRLFNELTKSVRELRALGEVGQAVSSSLDLETVLATIVSRATTLAGVTGGSMWEYDEQREEFHLRATHNLPAEIVDALRAMPIRKGEGTVGKLAVTGEPVVVRDARDEKTYQSRVRAVLVKHGYRAILAVPLLRDKRLLGGLAVNRDTPGDFAPEVVDLLKAFATQSALAIQNARLFREIEAKGRELETASRHKSEFLANMSHELRTPLNAILGFSELLSERLFGDINAKQAEYLGDIQESGRHLLSLINDILDLAKIEAGRMELEPSDFPLPDAIANTMTLVRERAQRREVALVASIDPRLGRFRADERKLKQILLNLLTNAIKFTPDGGRVEVAARPHDGGVEIAVSDTGVGIAPEDQEAVFEEFRQVGAASRKVEGTGLGLAITRKFVELHGGRIWVKSQPGQGSRFTFTLPGEPAV